MDTLVGGTGSGSFGHLNRWAVSGRVLFRFHPCLVVLDTLIGGLPDLIRFTVTTLEDTLGFKVGGGQVIPSLTVRGGK